MGVRSSPPPAEAAALLPLAVSLHLPMLPLSSDIPPPSSDLLPGCPCLHVLPVGVQRGCKSTARQFRKTSFKITLLWLVCVFY